MEQFQSKFWVCKKFFTNPLLDAAAPKFGGNRYFCPTFNQQIVAAMPHSWLA
jgi:hypothetical protein